MAITVKYFASLRERMGREGEQLPHRPGLTVLDVWAEVCGGVPFEQSVRSAVNLDYVPPSHVVEDGDEVAFFPPVTGG